MTSLPAVLNEALPPSYFIAMVGSPAALSNLDRVTEMAREGVFPMIGDLLPAVYVAVMLCLIRFALHRCFFRPLALRALKLEAVTLSVHDPALDAAFRANKNPSVAVIKELIPRLSGGDALTVEQVQQEFWLRRRRASQELRITKFVEALWRCLFYTFFSAVGFFTLWYPTPLPWMLPPGPLLYFDMWPVEPLRAAVQYYYLLELGSYLHQLMWTDVSRSDSVEMMAHHVITLLLIAGSYLFQFMRIGTVIMALHDVPDVFLEAGKCMNYISKGKGGRWLAPYTDIMFGVFATLFFVTRIVIYPYIIYHANTVCSQAFGEGNTPSYLFFIGLLLALQGLHWFWFFLIVRMAYRLLWLDGGVDDIRSDDDDEEEIVTASSGSKNKKNSSTAADSGEGQEGGERQKKTTRTVRTRRSKKEE